MKVTLDEREVCLEAETMKEQEESSVLKIEFKDTTLTLEPSDISEANAVRDMLEAFAQTGIGVKQCFLKKIVAEYDGDGHPTCVQLLFSQKG